MIKLLDKRIALMLIFIVGMLSISAVNAVEDSGNSDIVDDSPIIVESTQNVTVSDLNLNDSAQTVLAKNTSTGPKSVTLSPSKLSTTYRSGKYFKVKVIDSKTKNPVAKVKLILKVYTGKKYKKFIKTTDSKGIAKLYASTLSIGSHKVTVNVKDSKLYISKKKTSLIKISKAKPIISASNKTSYYKESKKYKIIIKNKESKKPMKNIKVLIKVYTGKKYKQYSLKTDENGTVGFNMKSLNKSKHKVIITVKATTKVKSASKIRYIKTIARPNIIKLKVNNHVFNVKLESNSAAKALMAKLKKGNITIYAEDYGNFEKVGELGFSLPRSDKYITTSLGDIVLYNGDEISLFYNSNSWSYTKLGKVQNTKDLKSILGTGDATLVFSLK